MVEIFNIETILRYKQKNNTLYEKVLSFYYILIIDYQKLIDRRACPRENGEHLSYGQIQGLLALTTND